MGSLKLRTFFSFLSIIGLCHSQQTDTIVFSCPSGWTYIGTHCIRLFSEADKVQTWKTAQKICEGQGGQLPMIDDYYVNDALGSFAKDGGVSEFWISFNRKRISDDNSEDMFWGDKPATKYEAFWGNDNPNFDNGDCVYIKHWVHADMSNKYSAKLSSCKMKRSFICQRPSCLENQFHCGNGMCVQNEFICDGQDDCGDFSDEYDCSNRCHYKVHATASKQTLTSPRYPEAYEPSEICRWTIEGPLGSNIFINFTSFDTEKNMDVVQILIGGLTEDSAISETRISGHHTSKQYKSNNNYLIIKFYSDSSEQRSGFSTEYWSVNSNLAGVVELTATDNLQYVEPQEFPLEMASTYLDQDIGYVVTSQRRTKVITLETIEVNLGMHDQIVVYDGDSPSGAILAEYTAEKQGPKYVFSTKDKLFIFMLIGETVHNQRLRFAYKQGCRAMYNSNSGIIFSPGYPNANYANFQTCEWTIQNPMNKPATLYFEKGWEIEDTVNGKDYLEIYLKTDDTGSALHSGKGFTSSSLVSPIVSPDGKFFMRFKTGAVISKKGFQAFFSIDCPDPMFNGNTLKSDTMSWKYKSMFTVSCKTGHYFAQEEFQTKDTVDMECLIGGSWNRRTIPQCMPVHCNSPPEVEHGYVKTATGLTYDNTVVYSCFDGYSIGSTDTIKCLSNGLWQQPSQCFVAQCSLLSSISNGEKKVTDGDGIQYGSIVRFTCNEGYEIKGTAILFCSNVGWSGPEPTCSKLHCPLPRIMHATFRPSDMPGPLIDETVDVICDAGYQLNGGSITCLKNRTFGNLPECKDINECTDQANPCSAGTGQCFNTVPSFYCTCQDGYYLSSDQETCDDINECASNNGGCESFGQCNNEPGSYTCDCDDNVGHVLFENDGTSDLYISSEETGLKYGDVLYMNHTCVPIKCPDPDKLLNGNIMSGRKVHRYRDHIEYFCDAGYDLIGVKVRDCAQNGQWTSVAPTCEPISCPAASIPNGIINRPTISPPGRVGYLEVVNLTCDVPGKGISTKQLKCIFNKGQNKYELAGPDYECGVIDCYVPTVLPGSSYGTPTDTYFDDTFTFGCGSLYEADGSSEDKDGKYVVRCESDGKWNFKNLRCIGATCPNPGLPSDGILSAVDASNFKEGGKVTFSCERTGFEAKPVSVITCELNQNALRWSFTGKISCKDIESPRFIQCQDSISVYRFSNLADTLVVPPATDNVGIKMYTIDPNNANTTYVVTENLAVVFTVEDFEGNSKECQTEVLVIDEQPPSIECPLSTIITLTYPEQTVNLVYTEDDLLSSSDDIVQIDIKPSTIIASAAQLDKQFEFVVRAYDANQNMAMCKFNILIQASLCSPDYLQTPQNGEKNCTAVGNGYDCVMSCIPGFAYFEHEATSVTLQCTGVQGTSWDKMVLPACVPINVGASVVVISKVMYHDNRLTLGRQECLEQYKRFINSKLSDTEIQLEQNCGISIQSSIPFDIQIKTDIEYEFIDLYLYATYKIVIGPQSADIQAITNCASNINSVLKLNGTIFHILKIYGETGQCPTLNGFSADGNVVYTCAAGDKLAEIAGQQVCLSCPPGTYTNNTECIPCQVGFYQDQARQSECRPCPSDTSTYRTGTINWQDCSATCGQGMYASNGLGPCVECPLHTFSNPNDPTLCDNCIAGTITEKTGSSSETQCLFACSAGHFSYSGFGPSCKSCPYNFYQASTGQRSCEECRSTNFTESKGSISQNLCLSVEDRLCNTAPCKNGATCRAGVIWHDYFCACVDGFYGRNCEIVADRCASSPCFNGGICDVDVTKDFGYKCTCLPGTDGDNCETDTNDDCQPSLCEPNGVCVDEVFKKQCYCKSGFTGESCSIQKDLCNPSPCKFGSCTSFGNIRFKCNCYDGYTGETCNMNIENCDSGTCLYGGMCNDLVNGFSCSCKIPELYSGDMCEVRTNPCNTANCGGNTRCVDDYTSDTFKCICQPGYTYGTACQYELRLAQKPDSSEVAQLIPSSSVDDCRQQCENSRTLTPGCTGYVFNTTDFSCQLLQSYSNNTVDDDETNFYIQICLQPDDDYWTPLYNLDDLDDDGIESEKRTDLETYGIELCGNTEPIDVECVTSDNAGDNFANSCSLDGITCSTGTNNPCTDYSVRYKCAVNRVFNDNTCTVRSYCQFENPCTNGGTCQDKTNGFKCKCVPGYVGSVCQHMFDSCQLNPCHNEGICTNGLNSYECNCSGTGYTGVICQNPILHCPSNPCDALGTSQNGCEEKNDEFYCNCIDGYTGKNCSENINDCASQPCQHGAECSDRVNGYVCECTRGWDGTQCEKLKETCATAACDIVGTERCHNLFNFAYCKCVDNSYGLYCDKSPAPCNDIKDHCLNSGICTADNDGKSSCSCPAKYGGDSCQYVKDHCSKTNICKNEGKCVPSDNTVGYECQCKTGYSGINCEVNDDDCDGISCTGGGVCMDGLGEYVCRCPFGKIGELCNRDINTDIDLYFSLQSRTSRAFLRYSPYVNSTTGLSISVWVKFSDKKKEASRFFTLLTVPSDNLNGRIKAKPLIMLDGTGLTFYDDGTPYTAKYKYFQVMDRKWHNIVVTWDIQTNDISLIVDTIRQSSLPLPGATINSYYWIVLGSISDPLNNPDSVADGFRGYISHLNLYSRVLDFNDEIPQIITDVQITFSDIVSMWGDYELHFGVQPVFPSSASLTSDASPQQDKEAPYTENCPLDVSVYGTGRMTTVPWIEPIFQGATTVESDSRPGFAFGWGKHIITYVATDIDGNAAFCSFKVFVKSSECNPPTIPYRGTHNCNIANRPFVGCEIGCQSAVMKIVQSHPNLYTCGPSGSWNPLKRFVPTHYPPCGPIQSLAKKRIFVHIVYRISTTNCIGVRSTLTELVLKTLQDLNRIWNNVLCREFTCNGIIRKVNCGNSGPRGRRAVETESSIDITIPEADPIAQNGLESLSPEEIIRRAVLEELLFNYEDSIPHAGADSDGFTLLSEFICPEGQTVIGDNCVTCSVGTFYNTMTATCDDCAVGSYQSELGESSCVPCGTGLTTEAMGSSFLEQCKDICPPGQYFSNDLNGCRSCEEGFYQEMYGTFYCNPCPVGQTTRKTGADMASLCYDDCPSGQELSAIGSCVNCSIGYYRTSGLSSVCLPCETGFTTKDKAAYSILQCDIVACLPGTYLMESNECRRCGYGYYQGEKWQTSCNSCDRQHRTDTEFSTSPDDCKFYCPDGEEIITRSDSSTICAPCAIGYYKNNTVDGYYLQCRQCSGNLRTENTGSTSQSQCTIFRCFAGTIPNAVQTECINCPKGTYQPDDDKTTCIDCMTGKSTRTEGSKSFDDCEVYCDPGSEKQAPNSCVRCGVGSYKNNDVDLFMPCTMCDDNNMYVTKDEGSFYQTDCDVRACLEGTKIVGTTCEKCPRGSYQDKKYQTICLTCGPNKSTRVSGASSSATCEKYCPSGEELDMAECVDCSMGYFKDNAIDDFSTCTMCDPEFITPTVKAVSESECTVRNCSAGEYLFTDNNCRKCEIAKYQPTKWQTSCKNCPVDTTTEEMGATSMEQCNLKCPAGKEDKGGACIPCQQGFYKELDEASECVPCLSGFTTVGSGSKMSSDCSFVACAPGTYLNPDANICINCPFDQYQPSSLQYSCLNCSTDYVTLYQGSDFDSDCVFDCLSGTEYDSLTGTCVNCKIGYFRNKMDRSQVACTMCDPMYITDTVASKSEEECNIRNCTTPGFFRNPVTNQCESCPFGTYNSQKWRVLCQNCPLTYTTPDVGSVSEDQCEPDCLAGEQLNSDTKLCERCMVGYYRDKAVSRMCLQCPNNKITQTDGSDSVDDCDMSQCLAGEYGDVNGDCVSCQYDRYQTKAGMFECEKCAVNKFTSETGATASTDCLEFCETGRHSCGPNTTCVSNEDPNHHDCPCNKNYQGSNCVHMCDMSYCMNSGSCQREDTVTCICSSGYTGERCDVAKDSRDQSQRLNETVIAAVVSVLGVLLIIIIIVVACCALQKKRQKKAKSIPDTYPYEKASLYTRMSNAPYDNFTMMRASQPPSVVGTQRLAMGSMGDANYDNVAFVNDSAVYQA